MTTPDIQVVTLAKREAEARKAEIARAQPARPIITRPPDRIQLATGQPQAQQTRTAPIPTRTIATAGLPLRNLPNQKMKQSSGTSHRIQRAASLARTQEELEILRRQTGRPPGVLQSTRTQRMQIASTINPEHIRCPTAARRQ